MQCGADVLLLLAGQLVTPIFIKALAGGAATASQPQAAPTPSVQAGLVQWDGLWSHATGLRSSAPCARCCAKRPARCGGRGRAGGGRAPT